MVDEQTNSSFRQFVPFDEKYPPEWLNMNGEMVLVKNDITATWKAMEDLVTSGR
jgi:hypothetical protein